MSENALWDVIVVGGGPSGMMSGGRAGELGAKVILIEKNDILGKKLLITGGGRCNVTNAELDNRKLLEKFKSDGKFLFSAFSKWSVKDTLNFFHKRGMETKIENEQRVFPVSNNSASVLNVLIEYVKENNVTILSNSSVCEIVCKDKKIIGVKLKNGKVILGHSVIIGTGGTSRPETGSTGDGYVWLRKIGHSVSLPTPSLVPVSVKDEWVKKLSGVSLTDIKITVFQNNIKQNTAKGKILFTHVGLSGPAILNLSKDIGELLKYGEVNISLDLLPLLDYGTLNTKLQELFKNNDKKKLKNTLGKIVPNSMAQIILEIGKVNGETACNSVTREDRIRLSHLIKNVSIKVEGLLGTDKAVITSGGVSLEEVDFKSMRSKLFPNLYLVGDILNIDRPSGGYSLQLCWTTGFVAGTEASKK